MRVRGEKQKTLRKQKATRYAFLPSAFGFDDFFFFDSLNGETIVAARIPCGRDEKCKDAQSRNL